MISIDSSNVLFLIAVIIYYPLNVTITTNGLRLLPVTTSYPFYLNVTITTNGLRLLPVTTSYPFYLNATLSVAALISVGS